MEFGIFVQGYTPGPAGQDPSAEHAALMQELDLCILADKHNWKFAWVTEHHGLAEYSHLSASEVFLGYLAHATERIHLGSGIFNLSPRACQPARNAERVAMLDHLSNGRFEFGTGRGAGSHEVATFDILDVNSTRSEWDEALPQILRMFRERDYTFSGEHFSLSQPHDVLPKPLGPTHPPLWLACGSPSTYEKAGSLGLGVLGFNFSPISDLAPLVASYKDAVSRCTTPVGDYVNDNVMLTSSVICLEDRDRARAVAKRANRGYLFSLVCLYHDTFPKPKGAPVWPEPPIVMDDAMLDRAIEAGTVLCGTPDEVSEQLAQYDATGLDQLCFGMPHNFEGDEAAECIELFGRKVIPEFDKDPVVSTAHYRASVAAGEGTKGAA